LQIYTGPALGFPGISAKKLGALSTPIHDRTV